jgi:hypothetical protein
MTGIQVITIALALFMLFITYTTLRRNELRFGEFALWTAIWLGLLLVSLFPDVLRGIIVPLHVIRLLDLVTIIGLLVVTILVFTLNRTVRRLDDRLTAIVRALALREFAESEKASLPTENAGPGGSREGS